MHICEHCTKNFSSKSNLTRHINRNYCNILNKQKSNTASNNTETNATSNIEVVEPDNEEIIIYECTWCKNSFNIEKEFVSHEKDCENKYLKLELKNIEIKNNNILEVFNDFLELFANDFDKKESVLKIKEKISKFKSTISIVSNIKLKKKKKSTVNIDNLKGILIPDVNLFNNIIEEYADINYLKNGLRGFAKLISNYFLKNEEDDTFKYICTNTSQKVFRFYNKQNIVIQDINASKLINFIIKTNYKKVFEKIKQEAITNLEQQYDKNNIFSLLNDKITREIADINHNYNLIINIEINGSAFARYLTEFLVI